MTTVHLINWLYHQNRLRNQSNDNCQLYGQVMSMKCEMLNFIGQMVRTL